MVAGPHRDGVPVLPAAFTSRGQRERLLAGALEAVVARGYPATSVADIVRAAGVSRATFYECFANKDECVLATYDLIVDWLGMRIANALAGIDDWVDAVRAAVKVALAGLDVDQRMARFCAVEILCLGRVGFARYEASIERLAVPLRAGRAGCPWGSRLPLGLELTTVGGAIWLVGHRTRPDGSIRLTGLAPDIVYFLLTPYLDPGPARRAATSIGPVTGALPPGPGGAVA
jgi:AcrR family transcriptional regulator